MRPTTAPRGNSPATTPATEQRQEAPLQPPDSDNPNKKSEKQIVNGRICGDISVSRAFGDMRFKTKKN
ncbi:unnamed protein product, partial [Ilex paraguariensis]